jgi:hypothetical protein
MGSTRQREKGERKKVGCAEGIGLGSRPRGEKGKEEKEEGHGLSCAEGEREISWASWAGPCGGRERKSEGRLGWAASEEKEGKKKKKSRPGSTRKWEKKCIQMHLTLNLKFKFKFKWKTNNKTIQWGMKCTKSILPYISFYSLLNCY